MAVKKSNRQIVYQQKKERGCCPRCGNKLRKNYKFSYCEDCRNYFRNYNKESAETISAMRRSRYEQRKQNNQCPRCGKSLGKRYKKIICAECLEKQHKYN